MPNKDGSLSLLQFMVGGLCCGVDMDWIVEVAPASILAPAGGFGGYADSLGGGGEVQGWVLHRGARVPLVDLRKWFHRPVPPLSEDCRLLFVQRPSADHSGAAVVVDALLGRRDVDQDDLGSVPSRIFGIDPTWVAAILKERDRDQFLFVLDPAAFLSSDQDAPVSTDAPA